MEEAYYEFYRPWDMKLIKEGTFVNMQLGTEDCPIKEVYDDKYNYYRTGIMNREMAVKFQSIMGDTFFTDLMDEYETNTLVYRIT